LNDELFARSQHTSSDFPDTAPPPKPVAGIGFSDKSNPAFKAAESLYNYQMWEQKDKQWDENEALAIPPAEDVVWIRKGHEEKNISVRDTNIEMWNKALGRRASLSGPNAPHAK
jgi:hypothetical protein